MSSVKKESIIIYGALGLMLVLGLLFIVFFRVLDNKAVNIQNKEDSSIIRK